MTNCGSSRIQSTKHNLHHEQTSNVQDGELLRVDVEGHIFNNPQHRVIANDFVWSCVYASEFNCPARVVSGNLKLDHLEIIDAKLIHNHDRYGQPGTLIYPQESREDLSEALNPDNWDPMSLKQASTPKRSPRSALRKSTSNRERSMSLNSSTSSTRPLIKESPLRRSPRLQARRKTSSSRRSYSKSSKSSSKKLSRPKKVLKSLKNLATKRRSQKLRFAEPEDSKLSQSLGKASQRRSDRGPRIESFYADRVFQYTFHDNSYINLTASIPTLKALRDADHIAIDESFNILPASYAGAVIIHAKITNRYRPIIFAMLSDVNEKMYERLIRIILERIPGKQPNPMDIAVPLTSLMRNVLQSCFPNAELKKGISFGASHRLLAAAIGSNKVTEETCTQAYLSEIKNTVYEIATQTAGFRESVLN